MNKTLLGLGFVVAALGVWGIGGCGKKEASCDAVFEHIRELAPADMRDMFDTGKDTSVAKCEATLTVEQRKCILAAADLADASACKKK